MPNTTAASASASAVDTPSTMASSCQSPVLNTNESPTPLHRNHTPMTNNTPPIHPPPTSGSAPSFAAGPITLDPFTTPSAALNPRSCVTCRRRKVRCDKHMPCGNCRKAQIQCVFPAPGRAPRRPRAKDPNAPPKQTSEREIELMKRLRKLESIVEDLSGQIEFETYKHGASESPEAHSDLQQHENERRKMTASPPDENSPSTSSIPPGFSVPRRTNTGSSMGGGSLSTAKSQPGGDMNKDFGKLVLSEKGKVRYVSNAFWTKLSDEIEALRSETQRLTDDSSDSSDDEDSPVSVAPQIEPQGDHHVFIFGYSSSNVDLRSLHPLPSQMLFYWQVFMDNVDPIVKFMHVPTMTNTIKELRRDMSTMTPSVEVLMFVIYLAAITSMEPEEVSMNFGAEKSQLMARYRFATEQALAKANCVTTSELIVLQAFVLFLILVRRGDDTKFSTALTGLVVKIAQSLGLHRDGTHFDNISPFEIEMRRRLWWTICVLDHRSAEDAGCEMTVVERSFDTRFPLNVNDNDLSPEMTEFPPERMGLTDMSFSLIRFEVCALSRRIHAAENGLAPCLREGQVTLEEHEEKLIEMYEHIDRKFLRPSPNRDNELLTWVSSTIARLIVAKMSLVIYQPLMQSARADFPRDVRDRLFLASVEVVEYSRILNAETKIRRWQWLFHTYNQWHAVAYLLLEVCRRPWSPSVERAWIALNATFQSNKNIPLSKPAIWLMLRKLMVQAKRHRESEIARLRENPRDAVELDVEEGNKVLPRNFQHLPSSVRSSLARERWRKLVGVSEQDLPAPNPNSNPNPNLLASSNNNNGIGVPENSSSSSSSAGGGLQPAMLKAADMQFNDLSSAMSEPYFNPQDIFPLVFGGEASNSSNFQAVDAALAAQQQQQGFKTSQHASVPIENFNTRGFTALSMPEGQGGLRMDSDVVDPANAMTDDNPPPWLWNAGYDNNAAGGGGGYGNNMAMGDEQDVDVNMDANEVADWQNWVDSGLGINGVGFAGGI
ncbi:fungal-specific transcription factor domain-containing protein [Nemania sp. NC0429]|nr:fungal-specific transcription factor domain-containing protein [Nemania sp. NC0429]